MHNILKVDNFNSAKHEFNDNITAIKQFAEENQIPEYSQMDKTGQISFQKMLGSLLQNYCNNVGLSHTNFRDNVNYRYFESFHSLS
ncbi:MAG: hypothetical protein HW421_1131 [Ignavibacteria bacterium]|nr:hypothetical protein [Ignavibacteria bacterium]